MRTSRLLSAKSITQSHLFYKNIFRSCHTTLKMFPEYFQICGPTTRLLSSCTRVHPLK